MLAAVRAIHPAPAAAVTAVSTALALILSAQAGLRLDPRALVVVVSVAASQVATGAINDWVDRERDRRAGRRKPVAEGQLPAAAALWLGVAALAVQLLASAALGVGTLLLAAAASASAQLYNLVLSRTPLSVLPYLVSFGVLPAWIASGIGVPFERVSAATLLIVPFAAAAHLANALQDFESDAAEGSRDLAQILGRSTSRVVAAGLATAVGVGVVLGFAVAPPVQPASVVLGLLGIVAVAQGVTDDRRLWYGLLVAAVLWTVAWALSTG